MMQFRHQFFFNITLKIALQIIGANKGDGTRMHKYLVGCMLKSTEGLLLTRQFANHIKLHMYNVHTYILIIRQI